VIGTKGSGTHVVGWWNGSEGKMSAQQIKLIALIIIAMLACGGTLFAGGKTETEASGYKLWYKDQATKTYLKEYTLTVDALQGLTEVKVGWKNQTDYKYTILALNRHGAITAMRFTNPTKNNVEIAFGSQFFNNLPSGGSAVALESNSAQVVKAEFKSIKVNLSEEQKEALAVGDSPITASWSQYNDQKEYSLVALKADGGGELIEVTVAPEFFLGERELFLRNEFKNIPYEKKAIAFMGTFWKGTEEFGDFKTVMQTTFNFSPANASEWGMFDSLSTGSPELFKSYQISFREAFVKHFQYKQETVVDNGKAISLPYLEFGENSFKALYGGNRNVYTNAYLLFLFKSNFGRGKPVLAYKYQKILNQAGHPYNYKQFSMISQGEGKNLATMALRYLLWGVEYTPFDLNKPKAPAETGTTTNKVFDKNRQSIQEWVSTGGPDRQKNYFQGAILLAGAPQGTNAELALLLGKLTILTPFNDGNGHALMGNPLPYAAKGIDSPRTFAYKMWEQWRAREWYKVLAAGIYGKERFPGEDTTLAVDRVGVAEARSGYVTEDEAYQVSGTFRLLPVKAAADIMRTGEPAPLIKAGETIKPFLPGRVLNTAAQIVTNNDSPYNPDKIAGVDALGLLTGALSMAQIEGIRGALDIEKDFRIDRYYQMNDSSVGGLDSTKWPAFYVSPENGYLKENFRFTNSDLERSTVLVPDISLIQEGDLVVRYQENGEPHVGIVVGFTDPIQHGYGDDASNWWSKVMVVSVMRGFRMVNLSTWGNASGALSSFAIDPKMYQIRRLVKFNEQGGSPTYESWDLMTDVQIKERTDYPPETNVPHVYTTAAGVAGLISGVVSWGGMNKMNSYFYHELPPTSISTKVDRSLFDGQMWVGQFTGWRERNTTTYHMGIDVNSSVTLDAAPFYAPEDGLFYVHQGEDFANADYLQIQSESQTGNTIATDKYSEKSYGLIGVLITNPENPRLGRVYVFCHLGPKFKDDEVEKLSIKDRKPMEDSYLANMSRFPDGYENAILVRKGAWIGNVGLRGDTTGYHVHLEVWEYFDDDASGYNWERVDPLTVFSKELFNIVLPTPAGSIVTNSTYGWWSRVKGNQDTMTAKARETHPVVVGIELSDAIIDTWSAIGNVNDNWVSFKKYSEFVPPSENTTENTYRTVFKGSSWENERTADE
jgi:hypothetical protein